jgi:acetyl-CoA carboxylase biotin carboxyl carrier protein
MTPKEVQEMIRYLVEYDIEDFEYEKDGVRLHIHRHHSTSAKSPDQATDMRTTPRSADFSAAVPPTIITPPPAVSTEKNPVGNRAEELHIIRSPIVGTFYKAPKPDAPPFVKVGSRVEAGQTMCIIEAMKLMNEVESDMSGEIVETFVDDKQPVEYGQALFSIRPASTAGRP